MINEAVVTHVVPSSVVLICISVFKFGALFFVSSWPSYIARAQRRQRPAQCWPTWVHVVCWCVTGAPIVPCVVYHNWTH